MKKSNFQILISIVIPFIVTILGGVTLLWDTFSKYNHVFSKRSSLILAIVFFWLPFLIDFLLSQRPIEWVFNEKTKGKLKSIKPHGYILSWVLCLVFSIYFFTYSQYKGITQASEDSTINLIKTLKEKPFFLTGFFLPTNRFIDSTWHLTRDNDLYYQGQTYPEDPYTFVNDFYIHQNSRQFFTSNVQEETVTVTSLDTLNEKNDSSIYVEGKRLDSINLKDLEIDRKEYYIYFTDEFLNEFKVVEQANNVNLPKRFRELLEKFEKPKSKNSFSYISRKNKNFIVVSSIQDKFNRGDPKISFERLPLISLENLQTLYSFSEVMIDLYNETDNFLKARNIVLDLNKIQYMNFVRDNE